jgi:hypothetical protein
MRLRPHFCRIERFYFLGSRYAAGIISRKGL